MQYPGFHVSREARLRYHLDTSLFTRQGKAVFKHMQNVRKIVRLINRKRNVVSFPEDAVKTGQLNGMALIDEILDYLFGKYVEQNGIKTLQYILAEMNREFGEDLIRSLFRRYLNEFPPEPVFENAMEIDAWLKESTDGIDNSLITLKEICRLWLTDTNAAFDQFKDIFEHHGLKKKIAIDRIYKSLLETFDILPPFGPQRQNLLEMLHEPAVKFPHSIQQQLEYIRKKWGSLLDEYYFMILRGLDFIREEDKLRMHGAGESVVYRFAQQEYLDEPERFSPDKDWMPRLVLVAKTVYVWLHQLSKKYRREIRRLDQIPDEELDMLSRWGFTGLWLIGIWRRSHASRKLKHLLGKEDAIASAYSLWDYVIADDLGGEEALNNLRERAMQRGIRLGSDMVPNHMGIDSKWVMEHPDWFVQLNQPPFPSYRFHSANLSEVHGVTIQVEDHYYSRSDAAVVFKYSDNNGERYIYHGNDGTNMPWNDTAQLNYLLPEVRKAVIDKIIDIARQFPIIRFDAAMTLAKKHYQRLWFPQPGSGGDIPSRAEFGMTKEDFDKAIPEEFWREVVDRAAVEAPDTLLLAEAFWLMEGYFVRTLGMHRVYNSAFMNMLKNEENGKYRETIRNVLEYNPEILKRFVNFMNNPDEETAIAQFGSDDKYFGVCMLMVTMPGLPMFGHGQVEGYSERYGMEYHKPMWEEHPNEHLVRRHEREIFPLMRKRYLFSGVEHFVLYDFIDTYGNTNENVFAYSNRYGDEHALVVYHNKFEEARGSIRFSSLKTGNQTALLGDNLHLTPDSRRYVIFRDTVTGFQFIRNSLDLVENGLYIELGAFKYQVFVDFHEVEDDLSHRYANLHEYLVGRGVPDMGQALKETFLRPLHERFTEVFNPQMLMDLTACEGKPDSKMPAFVVEKLCPLLTRMTELTHADGDIEAICDRVKKEMNLILYKGLLEERMTGMEDMMPMVMRLFETPQGFQTIAGWVIVHRIGEIEKGYGAPLRSRAFLEEWLLDRKMYDVYRALELSEQDTMLTVGIIRILTEFQNWWRENGRPLSEILEDLLESEDIRSWIQVNRYHDVLWFNKEMFENLMGWLFTVGILGALSETEDEVEIEKILQEQYLTISRLIKASHASDYRLDKLMNLFSTKEEPKKE